MKITVRVKDIEIVVDDNAPSIKFDYISKDVLKTISLMCEECMKLLKERNI